MKKSLLKLVDVVLAKLQEQPQRITSESGIRTWLAQQGYAKRDIEAAINVVRPRLERMDSAGITGPAPLRHFSAFESYKLSTAARDALVRLDMYELLEPTERELVLDRLEQFEGEVSLEDLDYLVSWIVCSTRDHEYQQTIYSVLEGNDTTLH